MRRASVFSSCDTGVLAITSLAQNRGREAGRSGFLCSGCAVWAGPAASGLLKGEGGHLLVFIRVTLAVCALLPALIVVFGEGNFGGVQNNRRGRLEDSDCNRLVAREIFLFEIHVNRELIVIGRGELRKPLGAGNRHERQNKCQRTVKSSASVSPVGLTPPQISCRRSGAFKHAPASSASGASLQLYDKHTGFVSTAGNEIWTIHFDGKLAVEIRAVRGA